MATKRQMEEQDRASDNRRNEAVGAIVEGPDTPTTSKEYAAHVLEALAEAIDAEGADVAELKRKGWQTALKTLTATAIVVRGWRDLLTAYTPPAGRPEPLPADTDMLDKLRAQTPDDLDARLDAAFGIPPVTRHITAMRTDDTKGPMCGSDTGSWTHPGGANCEECHALYAQQNGGPYAGPGHVDAAAILSNRRDEPITPTVAREIRAEVESEAAALLAAGGMKDLDDARQVAEQERSFIFDPNTPPAMETTQDKSVVERLTIYPPDHKIGDKVTVGGIEFTKHSEVADALDVLNIVDPVRRPSRARLTLDQVQAHGAARNRGERHRSVSQVEGFSDCGTRYALSDQESPAWWNVGGKALHRCVETINRYVAMYNNLDSAAPGVADANHIWLEAFDREILDQCAASPAFPLPDWRAAKKGNEGYDWWRVEGPPMVEKYVTWLRGMLTDGWEIARTSDGRPVIELELYTNVGASVPNLSIIDFALYHASRNLLLIVDCKAGGSAPKSTFQLGVYGWASLGVMNRSFMDAFTPERVRGVYYRARTGELVPGHHDSPTPGWPILTMHRWEDVVARYRGMDAVERQHFYQPNVTTFCGGCGVKDLCPAQAL